MGRDEFLMTQISEAQRRRQSSLGFLIQILARRIDQEMKQRLAEIGIDTKIFANLMLLSEGDGITQRELGRMLEFPEYYTSRTVDILVAKGLAERRPDPDSRRSVLIFLTSKGREKTKALPSIISAVNSEYLGPLNAKDRQQLVKLLQRVARIDEHGDPNL